MASFAHAHNTDDNLERTLDEVEALRSILGEENITCNMNTDGVNLCIKVISPSTQSHETNDNGDNDTTTTTPLPPPPPHLHLSVTLPAAYPSHAPPTFHVSAMSQHPASTPPSAVYQDYLETFGQTWYAAEGEVMVFECIQWLSDRLEEWVTHREQRRIREETSKQRLQAKQVSKKAAQDAITASYSTRFVHGETLTDRKSVFQAHVAKTKNPKEIHMLIQALKSGSSKIAKAAHNIWAYRVGETFFDNDDDGETAAGKRLALMLESGGFTNVLVVVTRWYGGIHLGPDRFRHIKNVARILLVREGFDASGSERERESESGSGSGSGSIDGSSGKTARRRRELDKKNKKVSLLSSPKGVTRSTDELFQWLAPGRNGTCLASVRVKPNASTSIVLAHTDSILHLALDAPARDGKANDAAIKFISKIFKIPKTSVVLLSGVKNRNKIFEIVGYDIEKMREQCYCYFK
jgi:uncharacterized protein (TIGR00251 family)